MTIIKEITTLFPVKVWKIGQEGKKFYLLYKDTIIAISYNRSEIERKLKEIQEVA
jgi:hypothetical protein